MNTETKDYLFLAVYQESIEIQNQESQKVRKISAILTDEKLNEKKSFHSSGLSMLLNFWLKTMAVFRTLVVWDDEAYCYILKAFRTCRMDIPEHKVIILRHVLDDSAEWIAQEFPERSNLSKEKLSEAELSRAEQDVRYIFDLYCHLTRRFRKCTGSYDYFPCYKDEKTPEIPVIWIKKCKSRFYVSKSKLVRDTYEKKVSSGCKQPIKEEERPYPETEENVAEITQIDMGPAKEIPAVVSDEEKIDTLCEAYGFTCSISDGIIFLRTPFAYWRIYYSGNEVTEVYHENYRNYQGSIPKKYEEGFHRQNVKKKTLNGVLKYIARHEKGFVNRLDPAGRYADRIFSKLKSCE